MAFTNADLYNAVRNKMDMAFQTRMPKADATNFASIAQMITSDEFTAERNQFLAALLNRIGRELFTHTNLKNRLSWAFIEPMEYGAIIEQIGVDVINAEDYSLDDDKLANPYKTQRPDVKTYFYHINSQRKYRVTVSLDNLKQAFVNEGGLSNLVSMIVDKLHQSAEIDRWFSIKETFQKVFTSDKLLDSQKIKVEGIGDKDSALATIKMISTIATDMGFPTKKYNEGMLTTMLDPEDLILFVRQDVLQVIDKDVLAYAFNPEKLGFSRGGNLTIEPMDNFGNITALDSVPTGSTLTLGYNAMTQAEVLEGNKVVPVGKYTQELPSADTKNVLAVLCDKRRLMAVNHVNRFESIFNPAGLYENYFLHDWNTFTQSGMHNLAVFYSGTWA